jgi:hypothetical protein
MSGASRSRLTATPIRGKPMSEDLRSVFGSEFWHSAALHAFAQHESQEGRKDHLWFSQIPI